MVEGNVQRLKYFIVIIRMLLAFTDTSRTCSLPVRSTDTDISSAATAWKVGNESLLVPLTQHFHDLGDCEHG